MPTGGLIGQAVLDHEPNRQGDDAMRVVGFGQGVNRGVGVEELVTRGATMLRIREMDVAGPTGNQVTKIVQDAGVHGLSKTAFATAWTKAMFEVAAASDDLGLG
jgi:hypothetical protein